MLMLFSLFPIICLISNHLFPITSTFFIFTAHCLVFCFLVRLASLVSTSASSSSSSSVSSSSVPLIQSALAVSSSVASALPAALPRFFSVLSSFHILTAVVTLFFTLSFSDCHDFCIFFNCGCLSFFRRFLPLCSQGQERPRM